MSSRRRSGAKRNNTGVGISKSTRLAIYERDEWTCKGCGFVMPPDKRDVGVHRSKKRDGNFLTLDHIVPKRHGGAATPNNLQVLCEVCNNKKGCGSLDNPVYH